MNAEGLRGLRQVSLGLNFSLSKGLPKLNETGDVPSILETVVICKVGN